MSIHAGFMVPHPPIIVPEIGRGEEQKLSATFRAYNAVAERITEIKPEVIIVSSPHAVMYADYFHISPGYGAEGDFSRFGVPDVSFSVAYDQNLVRAICRVAEETGVRAGVLGEKAKTLDHGVMVPLYFINKRYTGYKLVRIGLSGLPYSEHYRLGMCVKKAVEAEGVSAVYIASGDLSHKLKRDGPYGFDPSGPEYDEKIMRVMASADFAALFHFPPDFCDAAAECGHRSFIMMAGAFDCTAVTASVLSHEGPFGVGYGVCAFLPGRRDPSRDFLARREEERRRMMEKARRKEDAYVKLARMTVESYVRRGVVPALKKNGGIRCAVSPDGDTVSLPDELFERRAGVFVSLHKEDDLRGCIGTTSPCTDSVAEEIVANAVSAATRDPRFAPVAVDELDSLVYHVDVLSEPEAIASPEFLDVKKYGVICFKGSKRGLLLPDLDSVTTVRQQIEIACRKGGIDPDDNPGLLRFEVVRHT